MVADNFFRDLFKYGVSAALFFAGLIAVFELTGITNWERSPWVKERNQGTIKKAEFFGQFQHNLAKLEKWPFSRIFRRRYGVRVTIRRRRYRTGSLC